MKKTEEFFNQTQEQIKRIQGEMEREFPQKITRNFEIFVRNSIIELINNQGFDAMLDNVKKRLEISEKLNADVSETKEKELLKSYFETMDPNSLTNNLNKIIETELLKEKYNVFISQIISTFNIGDIVDHYRAEDEVFLFLQAALKESCSDIMGKLKTHNNNLKEYFIFLKEMEEKQKDINKGYRKTRLLTTLVAGPIASLAVQGLHNENDYLSQAEEKAFNLTNKLYDDWIFGVEKEFYNLSVVLKERYTLILYTLFGGLLLKLQQNLLPYGYEIKDFNWKDSTLNINLSDSNKEIALKWGVVTHKKILDKYENNEIDEALALSKYLYKYINENPIIAEIEIEKNRNLREVYANLWVSIEVMYLEKKYWKIGEYEKTMYGYKRILEEASHLNKPNELLSNDPHIFKLLINMIIYEENISGDRNEDVVLLFKEHPVFQHGSSKSLIDLYIQYKLGIQKNIKDDFSVDILTQDYFATLQDMSLNFDEFLRYVVDVFLKKRKQDNLEFEMKIQNSTKDSINSMFLDAIKIQDVSKVQRLLEANPNINSRNKEGKSPLLLAIEKNDEIIIDLILKKEPDLNLSDSEGDTALHYAVDKEDAKLVEKLLVLGAEPNAQNKKGVTPLLQSTYDNMGDLVDYFLKYGANPNLKDEGDIFPLFAAFGRGNFELVEKLIYRTNLEIKSDKSGGTTMLIYASNQNDKEMVERLLRAGADPNNSDYSQQTPIITAVQGSASPEVITTLVQFGAELNQQDAEGSTALINAAVLGHLSLVKTIVNEGANINIMDDYGNTALSESINEGHASITEYLMSAGAISID